MIKKKYIKPNLDVISFNNTDVICTSEPAGTDDTPDLLIKEGVRTGDTSYIDLMK